MLKNSCTLIEGVCVCCGGKGPKLTGSARLIRACKSPCDKLADQSRMAVSAIPTSGPGTELKLLLESLGIAEKPNCGCRGLMNEMNRLGMDGCNRERDRLVAALREKREAFGLADTARAAALALSNGLAFRISWFDPMPDLFDLAVTRAERKATPVSTDENTAGIPQSPDTRLDRTG